MNALLLDQVVYDLAVLKRLNPMVAVMEQALPPQNFAEIERLLIDSRGATYRRIETLVFSPSEDLGALAQEHLERHLDSWRLARIPRWLLGVARSSQADWAAYLLFDGGFASTLPGARVGFIWAPILCLAGLTLCVRMGISIASMRGGRPLLAVLLPVAALGIDLFNRRFLRSEYPDLHTLALITACVLGGLGLRYIVDSFYRRELRWPSGHRRRSCSA